ncbi:MAG: hypothetical protein JST34_05315 [Bacteroidetes bacterium]|nr:hypothetical protein [Bacteroidota bacterium]
MKQYVIKTNHKVKNNYTVIDSLSFDYDELFIKNVEEFKKKANKNKKYAIFYPSFGIPKDDKPEFLIYGQAVKGWDPVFNSSLKLNKKQLLKKAIDNSNKYYKGKNHTPLDWVNVYWGESYYRKFVTTEADKKFYPPMPYSTFRSFFWNVTYKLICRYYDLDKNSWDWSRKLVWSNLYKIAPAEGKNPNEEECSWQKKISIELIKNEIEEIKPKFCIVLTNDSWWKPFRDKLKTEVLTHSKLKKGIIQSIELYNGTKIIVTTRPYSGNSANHVNEILELIK